MKNLNENSWELVIMKNLNENPWELVNMKNLNENPWDLIIMKKSSQELLGAGNHKKILMRTLGSW